MSISQEEIKKTAEKLSKISGNDAKLAEKIRSTLSYVDLLQEIDTQGVKPTYNVIQSNLKLRDDSVQASSVKPKDLLACSNQKVISNQIVLPSIM